MLEAAIERQVRTVVVIRGLRGLTEQGRGRAGARDLYERISMHLDAHDDLGIVIADKPGGGVREDGRWLAETLPLTDGGTEYVAHKPQGSAIRSAPPGRVALLLPARQGFG
jgi:hypothetical protein